MRLRLLVGGGEEPEEDEDDDPLADQVDDRVDLIMGKRGNL